MATHHFKPLSFKTTMGPHEPVLRIRDGDTVVTTTVDGAGYDSRGVKIADWPNAQTGPLYIEDAEPGDSIAVRLDRIVPNRESAKSTTVVVTDVIEPSYIRDLPPHKDGLWRIDLANRVAVLIEPLTKLGEWVLPLAPMIGCFGVAPPNGQAITTSTSGPYGGNMDYRGCTEGVTMYFPVFVPGALFSLGDGHAAQGEGEIVGTGIEVSLDVEFAVFLRNGKQIRWPRGENADYIFTIGNARPLGEAVQHATTEMLRWLGEDFDLMPGAPAFCWDRPASTTSGIFAIPHIRWFVNYPNVFSCRPLKPVGSLHSPKTHFSCRSIHAAIVSASSAITCSFVLPAFLRTLNP